MTEASPLDFPHYVQVHFPFSRQQLLKSWVKKQYNVQEDSTKYPAEHELGNRDVVLVDKSNLDKYLKSIMDLDKETLKLKNSPYSSAVNAALKTISLQDNYNFSTIQVQRDAYFSQEDRDLHHATECANITVEQLKSGLSLIENSQFRLVLPKERELDWRKQSSSKFFSIRSRDSLTKIMFTEKEQAAVVEFFSQFEKHHTFQEFNLSQIELHQIPDLDLLIIQEELGFEIMRESENQFKALVPVFNQSQVQADKLTKKIKRILKSREQSLLPQDWPILSMAWQSEEYRQIPVEAIKFMELVQLQELPSGLNPISLKRVFNLPLFFSVNRSINSCQASELIQFYLVFQSEAHLEIAKYDNLRLRTPFDKALPANEFKATSDIKRALGMVSDSELILVCKGVPSQEKLTPSRLELVHRRGDDEVVKYEGRVADQEWRVQSTSVNVVGIGVFRQKE